MYAFQKSAKGPLQNSTAGRQPLSLTTRNRRRPNKRQPPVTAAGRPAGDRRLSFEAAPNQVGKVLQQR